MIYFDHNATTPVLPAARQAWLEATEKFIGNPSSPHRVGARADVALTGAREALATFLGCDALDIVWTSGATESNNMAIHHFARTLGPDAEIWVSAIEHPCILEATRHHFSRRHRLIPATRDGVVDLDWIRRSLGTARPGLVAVMAANNETGVLQPWAEILALCRERRIPYFCDAAQWVGKLPARGLGDCDFVSGCAHKFGGPKGVGFLKCPAQGHVEPLLRGGKQEEGRRAGTENVASVLSMVAALEQREATLRGAKLADGSWRMEAARARFEERILAELPGAEIVGAGQPRLWNTVSALMPQADCHQRWVVKLDKLGFAVSTGSACASGREEPSHVLAALGYPPSATSRVLRFSSGWETTAKEWLELADALAQVQANMRKSSSQAEVHKPIRQRRPGRAVP
jgi:cysteine desulfurase